MKMMKEHFFINTWEIAVDSSVEDSWSKGALKFYNVAHEHSTRGLGFRVFLKSKK
jgi:hypothetical protein